MKKPSATKLRVRSLDQQGLAKAQGGRGVIKGYMLCQTCGATTPDSWTTCPSCGVGKTETVYYGPGVRSL